MTSKKLSNETQPQGGASYTTFAYPDIATIKVMTFRMHASHALSPYGLHRSVKRPPRFAHGDWRSGIGTHGARRS